MLTDINDKVINKGDIIYLPYRYQFDKVVFLGETSRSIKISCKYNTVKNWRGGIIRVVERTSPVHEHNGIIYVSKYYNCLFVEEYFGNNEFINRQLDRF